MTRVLQHFDAQNTPDVSRPILAALDLQTRGGDRPDATTRILLVEDDPGDALMVGALLDEVDTALQIARVPRLEAARNHLDEHPVDCVLLDLSLPDSTGLDTLRALVTAAPDVPIVVLTGLDDAKAALSAVEVGAQDFLSKQHLSGDLIWRTVFNAMERKRRERISQDLAFHDPLTGLSNRLLLVDRLNLAMARLEREPGTVAVQFVDLDRFKWVNDTLGHAVGDALLRAVARRLEEQVRPPDLVARIGGDEFLILCERVPSGADALAITSRIEDCMRAPFEIEGHEVTMSLSIGLALNSDATLSADELIERADAAMYLAKRRSGSSTELYDLAGAGATAQLLSSDFRRALAQREFVTYFQPIVDLATGKELAVEALVRWQQPNGRIALPAEFIDLAEETGLVIEMGDLVLEAACNQLVWDCAIAADDSSLLMTVNISARQLDDPQFPARVRAVLARTGADPTRLGLEVTETSSMIDEELCCRALAEMKELGIRLLIDDFGTGFSSLSYLHIFPFDIIKIDQSFVKQVTEVGDCSSIVEGVIHLGRLLGLELIAEGVETRGQADRLRELGCTVAQGYYFGRPAPARAAPDGTSRATSQRLNEEKNS